MEIAFTDASTKSVDKEIIERRLKFVFDFNRYLVWGALGAAILYLCIWIIFPRYLQILPVSFSFLLVSAASAVFPSLHKTGKSALAIYFFLSSCTTILLVTFAVLPAVEICVSGAFFLFMTLAYQILGEQRGRVFSIIISSLMMADFFFVRLIVPAWFNFQAIPPTLSLFLQTLFLFIILALAIVIIGQVVGGQDKYLKNLRLMGIEVDRRAASESKRRIELEETVKQYVEVLKQVSMGDLTASIPVNSATENDPLTLLARNINAMIVSLQQLIQQIIEASSNLSSASAEILAATTQQAAGATEQSAAISQTSSTVEEVKTITGQFINRAQEVTQTAKQSVDATASGEQVIQETIASMDRIKTQVTSIAENIQALSESTQQIGNIITTVNEIASQSNILALNAAVEAAHAGEHGKGFAVVAAEVRNLSNQSKQATAQVRTILMAIQKAINTTVQVTQDGTKIVENGVLQASQAGKVIRQLSGAIGDSSLVASQMMASGHQQTAGIDQIAAAMQSIRLATLQGLASTRQTEKAAQDLNELALRLQKTIIQTRV